MTPSLPPDTKVALSKDCATWVALDQIYLVPILVVKGNFLRGDGVWIPLKDVVRREEIHEIVDYDS
jgi:hypothetical protein